jgi:hypothetical protein
MAAFRLATKLRMDNSMTTRFLTTAVLSLFLVGGAGLAEAGQRQRGGGGSRGSGGVSRGVPRVGGGVRVAPRVGRSFYRPSYRSYYYGPRFGLGLYGYPYGYSPYYGGYYGYGYGYGYPYGYGYGYPYAGGYVSGGYASNYGGVRIIDAARDAAVYADGYYVGTVDDFDGKFQHLDLEAGAHHIEIAPQGEQRIAFDVNVRPGQTITYRAEER